MYQSPGRDQRSASGGCRSTPPTARMLSRALLGFGIFLAVLLFYVANVHLFCGWSSPGSVSLLLVNLRSQGSTRILFLADPQIEGSDRSHREATGDLSNNVNDIYQKYVVSSLMRKLQPEMVVLLGDIFSYQHLHPAEHSKRYNRFLWIFDSGTFHYQHLTNE